MARKKNVEEAVDEDASGEGNAGRLKELEEELEMKKRQIEELEKERADLERQSSSDSDDGSQEEGDEMPETNLVTALGLCGLNSKQQEAFTSEGYESMSQLVWLKPESVKNLLSSIGKKKKGIEFKHIQQSTLRALVLWSHDQNKMDNDLDALEFTKEMLEEYRERDQLVDDEVEVTFQSEFEPNKWVSWN